MQNPTQELPDLPERHPQQHQAHMASEPVFVPAPRMKTIARCPLRSFNASTRYAACAGFASFPAAAKNISNFWLRFSEPCSCFSCGCHLFHLCRSCPFLCLCVQWSLGRAKQSVSTRTHAQHARTQTRTHTHTHTHPHTHTL